MKAPVKYLLIIAVFASFAFITCSKLSVNQSAPEVPSAPSPANGDVLDNVTIELSWSCSDPDGDPLSYDIYLDTSATPGVLVATVDTTSYTATGLHYNLNYYWQVIAMDTTGLETEGPVWSFSLGADMVAPACSLTSPSGGELWYINSQQTITWDAEDDDGIAFFVLEYSIDQGNNWEMIGDTISGEVRDTAWVIPSTPAVSSLVRIFCQDTGGNMVADTSSEIFTIWPQGGMIAFASTRLGGNYEIFTMYADGTHLTNLTNNLGGDSYPEWSPDCSKIVFYSDRSGNNEIYTMNNDGTSQLNISNNASTDYFPSWSPVGDQIAFGSNRRNASYVDIWIMNVDGTMPVALTSNNWHEYGAAWYPTGELIAYHSFQYGQWDIFVIDAGGLVAPVRLTTSGGHDVWPAWSPDGQLIAFESTRDGNSEIYTMNANGSNQLRRTNNPAIDNNPTWSPDGNRIIFASDRTGDYEIWVMDLDGSNLENLSNDLGTDRFPSWSTIH